MNGKCLWIHVMIRGWNILENFSIWYEKWKNSENLSNETYAALSLTINAIIEIVKYLLKSDI